MAAAFVLGNRFPRPDLLTCSVGATCDDLSSIAQRVEGLGYPVLWWEMPARRAPEPGEHAVTLPGGFVAPASQVAFVRGGLERLQHAFAALAGAPLDDAALRGGIRVANQVRRTLAALRHLAFTAPRCPLPALELLIAEMLVIHFCSDRAQCLEVLQELLAELRRRVVAGQGVLADDAVPVFWVNPVADLRVMNLLEDCGGRVCGTEYLFCHALDEIPEDLPPLEALARTALADPMVGPAADRAQRIVREAAAVGARAVVIARIPGASHCAFEGLVIADMIRDRLGLPVLELEVPPLSDALRAALRTRLEALIETAKR
jgi:benzoyl-CoA reductase/2-hydroxyglutaryl-CoA dehydratase subunit BcrC/BadD/HgdB